jgi:hypothetical protein
MFAPFKAGELVGRGNCQGSISEWYPSTCTHAVDHHGQLARPNARLATVEWPDTAKTIESRSLNVALPI